MDLLGIAAFVFFGIFFGLKLAIRVVTRCLAALFGPRAFSGTARIVDGDTIDVDGTRVRLFGIDAPEMGQSQGAVSKKALAMLLRGKTVTVRPVDRDRWGRIVGIVECEGHDVCRTMVAIGCALADRTYTRRYVADERRARRQGAGLWSSGEVQNGADYRHA